MTPLNPSERDCLICIARGEVSSRTCTEKLLRRLVALGLIETAQTCSLPLEMPARSLRLTPAGRAALDQD
jgi:hypothetical protein